MRNILYSPMVLFLAGCTTVPMTGRKKLLGLIPLPFTGGREPVPQTAMQMLIDQFAIFQYASVFLIIAGAAVWWFTKGLTGAGKLMVGLGLGLSIWGAVMPRIAGYVGLLAIISIVGFSVYFIIDRVSKKRRGEG